MPEFLHLGIPLRMIKTFQEVVASSSLENFLAAIIWDVSALVPGWCRVMLPAKLTKGFQQLGKPWGRIITSQTDLGPTDVRSPLCCNDSSRHFEIPIFCHSGVQHGPIWYTLLLNQSRHLLVSLTTYFFPQLPFLHMEDPDFPSSDTDFVSSFLLTFRV